MRVWLWWRFLLLVVFGVGFLVLSGCGGEESPPSPSRGTEEDQATASPFLEETARLDSTATPDAYPASTPTRGAYPHPEVDWTAESATPRPTFTPAPTLTPRSTPTATALPLLFSELSAEQVAAMGIWEAVDNDTAFPLHQVSRAPRGVTSVSWAADGRHLSAELLTSEQTMLGYKTVPMFLAREGESAWSPLILSNTSCRNAYDWSPDGSRLVFVRDGKLQITDAEGNLLQVFPPVGEDTTFAGPHFSPDGQRVAVTVWSVENDRAVNELWVYDLRNGGPPLPLDELACGARPSWSPQGDAIACLGQDNDSAQFPGGAATVRLNMLGGTPTIAAELVELPGTEGCLQPPQWIGNGSAVVATVLRQPGVWIVDRDGNVTSLSATETSRGAGHQPVAFATSNAGKASASPTGQYVLFDPGSGEVAVLDAATGERIPMPWLDVDLARWAPETAHFLTWAAYVHPEGDGAPLQRIDARTGQVETLDSSGSWPSWSPDGQRIAYWKKGEDGKMALWLLELGDEPVRLTVPTMESLVHHAPYRLTPQWSPDGRALAFVSHRTERPQVYVLEVE